MGNIIEEMVNNAREDFGIESFPGDFFEYIIKDNNYINKYKLVLFKQDLGQGSSGFMYYTSRQNVCICINYKDSIGHQNFTLAHEIGHKYLHKGISYDENSHTLKYTNKDYIEREANEFAAELLYPIKYVKEDLEYINEQGLFENGKEVQLSDFINKIVNRNYISFNFALLRLLFNSSYYREGNFVLEKVDRVIRIVAPLNVRYNKEMYKFIHGHRFYKPFIGILERQIEIGKVLVEKNEMGFDSVKAIIEKADELEGFDGTFI